MDLRAVKGTRDILPGEVEAWQWVEETCHRVFRLYDYREIRTPVFEPTELFVKSTGSDTDIVTKEMYTFADKAGRSLTLRPEGTPGVVRAVIQRGLLRQGDVDRLYYIGPMFRYERPQKGRYRQFAQIGVEVFGSAHPAVDAEVIEMAMVLFSRLGVESPVLRISSVGHAGCRPAYRRALVDALAPHRADLCPDCQRRLETNPLRILDCKVPGCAPIKKRAPRILGFLCEECRGHMDGVVGVLETLEVPHLIDPDLVRGLDYYSRTTFEITSSTLGAQDAVCGGGRYDDLVASMGGTPTPGVGFAIGADRLVMAAVSGREARRACPRPADVYIVHLGEEAVKESHLAASTLRKRGVAARFDPEPRELKKQMSRASECGARYALIIGERELERQVYSLKRMEDGVQKDVGARQWDQIQREIADGGQ